MMRVRAPWCAYACALVVFGCTTLAMASPQQAEGTDGTDAIARHMAAGQKLADDPSSPPAGKCEAAIEEFSKAYALSAGWDAMRGMALCEARLERDGAALAHYEEALRVGGEKIPADARAKMEADAGSLRETTAYVRVTSNQPTVMLTAARGGGLTNRYLVTADGITVGLRPGPYVFTASLQGFSDVVWKAEVPKGERLEHVFELSTGPDTPEPPPKPDTVRPTPASVWIMTGVTGAFAVTGAVLLGLATAGQSDLDDREDEGADEAELADLRSDVVNKNIAADVFLGATGASLVVTLILYFTRPEVPVNEGPKKKAWLLAPSIGPDAAGLNLLSSF